jgi:hypothetical protein
MLVHTTDIKMAQQNIMHLLSLQTYGMWLYVFGSKLSVFRRYLTSHSSGVRSGAATTSVPACQSSRGYVCEDITIIFFAMIYSGFRSLYLFAYFLRKQVLSNHSSVHLSLLDFITRMIIGEKYRA